MRLITFLITALFCFSARAAIVTGYQGYFQPAVTVTIGSGQQSSSAISTGGMALVGFSLPAAFTGTAVTFEVATTLAGTYQPLYDASNAVVSVTVTQGRVYTLDPKYFQGIQFLKIKSGSAEGAARSVVLALKGL